jgi:hypothetical protein
VHIRLGHIGSDHCVTGTVHRNETARTSAGALLEANLDEHTGIDQLDHEFGHGEVLARPGGCGRHRRWETC